MGDMRLDVLKNIETAREEISKLRSQVHEQALTIVKLQREVGVLRGLASSFEEQEQDDMVEIKELRRKVIELGGSI